MKILQIQQTLAQSKEAAKIRPMLGKVCVFGYITLFAPYAANTALGILHGILTFCGLKLTLVQIPIPEFPSEILFTLLATSIGNGGMRTYEKLKGVENNRGQNTNQNG